MKTEILDDDIILENGQLTKPGLINWIVIIILWVGIPICFWFGIITDTKVIFGLVLLFLTTVVMYYKYEIGVKFTFGLITLGLFGLVSYYPYSYSFNISLGNIGLSFEIVFFLLLFIHYFTNRKVLASFLRPIVNVFVPEQEEENDSTERRRIEKYKIKLSIKSTFELEKLLAEDNLVPEAMKAVEEIVEYRSRS